MGPTKTVSDCSLIATGAIQESAEPAAAAGMPKLAKCLGFDLPDTLASHGKILPDFFESMLGAVLETETHFDHALFAGCQRVEHLLGHFLQIDVDHRVGRRYDTAVFDEIAEMRIFFLTNRGFERNRLLSDFQDLSHFRNRNVHALGNFFAGWLTSQFLHES